MAASNSPRTQLGAGVDSTLEVHSILQHDSPGSPRRNNSDSSTTASFDHTTAMKRKSRTDFPEPSRPVTNSSSSRQTQASSSTKAESRYAQRDVRTLPPWIDSFEEGDDMPASATDKLLNSPNRAHSAQHHHTPAQTSRRVSQDGFIDTYDDVSNGVNDKKPETGFFGSHREPVRGRKWDHKRDGEPVIMRSGVLPTSSPWRTYIKASMYGPAPYEDTKRVNEEFLSQQTPGYERPWRGDLDGGRDPEKLSGLLHNKKQRRTLFARIQHTFLMHPYVPLMFRLTVLSTSTVALGLSSSVHHLSDNYSYPQNPSTTMAIVVDVVAIPYILYITWDEYTGKPLGLRSPKAKIRLVLLDLFFIIFESANLALAFAALTDDNGSCRNSFFSGSNNIICDRVKALCAILMIALVAWSLTFAVSIFRLVERVGGREEPD